MKSKSCAITLSSFAAVTAFASQAMATVGSTASYPQDRWTYGIMKSKLQHLKNYYDTSTPYCDTVPDDTQMLCMLRKGAPLKDFGKQLDIPLKSTWQDTSAQALIDTLRFSQRVSASTDLKDKPFRIEVWFAPTSTPSTRTKFLQYYSGSNGAVGRLEQNDPTFGCHIASVLDWNVNDPNAQTITYRFEHSAGANPSGDFSDTDSVHYYQGIINSNTNTAEISASINQCPSPSGNCDDSSKCAMSARQTFKFNAFRNTTNSLMVGYSCDANGANCVALKAQCIDNASWTVLAEGNTLGDARTGQCASFPSAFTLPLVDPTQANLDMFNDTSHSLIYLNPTDGVN